MPWNKDGSRKTAYYKKSGFTPYKKGDWTSPFMHNADKDDEHGRQHREAIARVKAKKEAKKKKKNKQTVWRSPNKFLGKLLKKAATGAVGLVGGKGGGIKNLAKAGLFGGLGMLGAGVFGRRGSGDARTSAAVSAARAGAAGNVDVPEPADPSYHHAFTKKEEPKKTKRLSAKEIIKNKPKNK